jgi:hypothetical protein
VISRTGANARQCYCSLLEVQSMAFIAQLTAGAMSYWEAATAVATLGSGILVCTGIAVYLTRRASR